MSGGLPALLLAAVLAARPAKPGASDAAAVAKAEAQRLLDAGADAYDRGDYAAALERFNAAYARFPSPKLWFNIGQANRDLERPVAALEAFERFLDEANDAPADTREEARGSAAELRKKLGRLRVVCGAPGAEVSLDGRRLGDAPLDVQLWTTPGRHQIAARNAGFVPALEDVEVGAGQTRTARVALVPFDSRPPPAPAQAPPRARDRDQPAPAVYQRAWFWVVVGAVVAGAVAATVWATRSPGTPDTSLGSQSF